MHTAHVSRLRFLRPLLRYSARWPADDPVRPRIQGRAWRSTSRPTLSQVLEQALAPFHARTSVYVKNLATGEEAGVRADEAFNSFSVIKLGIMLRRTTFRTTNSWTWTNGSQ